MSMLAMLVAACGGSNAEAISTDNGGKIMQSENKTNSSKALVVYYSRSGNTEALARMIGNETGADMFRVTTVTPYPEVYRETTELARAERDNNARPAINGRVEIWRITMSFISACLTGGARCRCRCSLFRAV